MLQRFRCFDENIEAHRVALHKVQYAVITGGGLGQCGAGHSPAGGSQAELDCGYHVAGLLEVLGKLGRNRVEIVLMQGTECLGDAPVGVPASRSHKLVGEGLAGEGVPEPVSSPRPVVLFR